MKPEVGQRPEDGSEVPSAVGTEKTRDVLDQNVSSGANKLSCDSCELEKEGGSLALESGAFSGDGEVLAKSREASDEQIELSSETSFWRTSFLNAAARRRSVRDFSL